MANVLDELGAYLVAEGVVTAIGSGTAPVVFLGYLPATPDYCLALTEAGGRPPEGGIGTAGIKFEYPAIQVTARGVADDDETPRALAELAWRKLAEIQAEALSGTQYLTVDMNGSVTSLSPDEKKRPRYIFVATCGKELS